MDKSGDENASAECVSGYKSGMFALLIGNSEFEKILELKMMENSGYRVSSVGTEFHEQATKSSSLIQKPVQKTPGSWWNILEVQEKEGEEFMGIGRIGSSNLGARGSSSAVKLMNSLRQIHGTIREGSREWHDRHF